MQLGETEKGSKEKPRRASLIAGMSEKTITLADALKLLALPRELGDHPDGKGVVAGQGRFGPYVKHGDEFRSLEDTDDVFTIDLARALELLAAPKKSRGRKTATRTVLKEVGPHPRGGAMINLLAGRYGPYVTDGTTNASLPKSMAPEQVTLEQAVELLAAREGAPKKGRAVKRASRCAQDHAEARRGDAVSSYDGTGYEATSASTCRVRASAGCRVQKSAKSSLGTRSP